MGFFTRAHGFACGKEANNSRVFWRVVEFCVTINSFSSIYSVPKSGEEFQTHHTFFKVRDYIFDVFTKGGMVVSVGVSMRVFVRVVGCWP